jgi:glutamate synthase (NADPH/NADH) large chain
VGHWKAKGIDLGPVLAFPEAGADGSRRCINEQDHGLDKALDHRFMADALAAAEGAKSFAATYPISNVNRTVGTLLGYEVTKRYGGDGLPDETVDLSFEGSAGQSFGAFLPRGITLRLFGDANDYFGKGLSGGRLAVRPPIGTVFAAEDNIISGNVILYGATAGEAFIRGQVGERFCVRNSGALAVVEGVGDHGCEYMTGGRVVVLGPTGRNFGAGMSGGIAYVYDPDHKFLDRYNPDQVEIELLDADDRAELLGYLEAHHRYTESAVAERLLALGDGATADFVKVMPTDYRRVLEATRLAESEGRSVDEAVMAAAHG